MWLCLHNLELGATDADAETLTDNHAGVGDVVEHGLVHGSEGVDPLTVHLDVTVRVALGEDAALGDKDNIATSELLLELLGELSLHPERKKKYVDEIEKKQCCDIFLYLYLLVEKLAEDERVDDGEGLLVGVNSDDGSSEDAEPLEVLLELIGGRGLDLLEGLDNLKLGLGRDALSRLGRHVYRL